ncbi:MAG: efflux RND transporter periplasmic adaptor subunit [Thermodesulfobacteriota bacterium]|nr:efflux RND transporter periplasmic adaptor subunit [Thermodesulfobacteriota bacterium]
MKRLAYVCILMGMAFSMGFIIRGSGSGPMGDFDHNKYAETEPKTQIWTCSMHPQIRTTDAGQCPICGMDLISAIKGDEQEMGERELKLSPGAMKLAEIRTAPVERRYVSVEIRMVGKVVYDETRLAYITARVPGRLDRLYVDYTGIPVKKGDHLVWLYSPELLMAQEELLQAIRALNRLEKSGIKTMRETALNTIEASREKLRLWGLTQKQISRIERSNKTSDHLTIYAPTGGIVIHKGVEPGEYVKTGTRLYTIADLSRLWIKLDAYESDLMWLRYGQEVHIETEAYPGQIFKGTIAFIDPVLDAKTRTVKVRVNVPNADGRLKPEMFVRTIVHARVAGYGKVMDAALAGKWICPMHPGVIKETAGSCDICGMPLARSESLGYISVAGLEKDPPPLVIPASAPLITGERAVVYVAHPGKNGVFEGREITLGPRAKDYYIVEHGLKQGERVVVYGNFKIDSALQILAKPSMMNPEGGVVPAGHVHNGSMSMPEKESMTRSEDHKDHETKKIKISKERKPEVPEAFGRQIDGVLAGYFKIQEALSGDQSKAAQKYGEDIQKILDAVDMGLLKGHAHMVWIKRFNELMKQARALSATSDIDKQRQAFHLLSESLISVVKQFGTGGGQEVLQFRCPMAFGDKGASWLQNKGGVRNPYFGRMMLTCGEQTATLVSPEN